MSICRGCGGTGVDAGVSPRAAQVAQMPILMRRTGGVIHGGGTSQTFRAQVVAGEPQRGRMRFDGPLILVIEHVEQRLHNGYEVVEGEPPSRALACQWCNGYGDSDGQLTVHALESLDR